MTPKEKALDLVKKMDCQWQDPSDSVIMPDHEKSIQCALVAVNEIINDTPMYLGNLNPKECIGQK